jgi:hypothetical protein
MQLVAVIHGFGGWNLAGDIIMNHINDFLLIKLDLSPSKHPSIYVQPFDLLSWIKFRGPESGKVTAKFQLYKSFQSLRTQGPQDLFEAPFSSHQKRSWPRKNPRAFLLLAPNFKIKSWLEVP